MYDVFKAGDIIEGLPHNGYSITGAHVIMRVKEAPFGQDMLVEILCDFDSFDTVPQKEWRVQNNDEKFTLYTPLVCAPDSIPTDMPAPIAFTAVDNTADYNMNTGEAPRKKIYPTKKLSWMVPNDIIGGF